MKHTANIVKPVMEELVQFETVRIKRWWVEFAVLFGSMIFVGVLFSAIIVWEMYVQQTWDLFSVFLENIDVIQEQWSEALRLIWEEVPHDILFFVCSAFVLGVFLVVVTSRKRRIIQKRFAEVVKYRQGK